MENYIVSARKYRPSTFESVVGQRALTVTLKNAIASQKLAHAYLFCGPRGVGKTTCARIFAKTINCLNLTSDGEACNQCESCVAFNEHRSYNIHELDAASNNSVDDIRQLVEQVRIPPQIGKYKVYIIDEVHMLSSSAFNAFLKTLEEPPHHAIFILATTEKHKILPTILSRCQIYDFNRISIEDTVNHLAYVAEKEGVTAEPEALNVIALKADGGMRDALSIFDQVVSFTAGNITYQGTIENLNVLDYDYYFRLTDYLLEVNISGAMILFNEVLNNGFEGGHFVTGLSSHFRDLLVSKDAVTLPLLEVGASIRQRYQQQAQKCPLPFLYKAIKLCNDCDLNYRNSKNKRLLVELTLIQIAQLNSGDGDDVSHGRSPQKTLKPVFTAAQAATPQQQPQQQASSQTPQTAVPSTQTNPATQATPSRAEMPDIIQKLAAEREKKLPTMPKTGLGLSIKKIQAGETATDNTPTSQQKAPAPPVDYPFDESNLNYCWHEYANSLPIEHNAIKVRMQNMRVKLVNETMFEITVDNELAANNFMALASEIEAHMHKQLRNNKIKMSVHITETAESSKAITKNEKFLAMAEKNKALIELKDTFGLEYC